MAMYDWSGNKNDMFNNSNEYQIYRNCTNNTSTLQITLKRCAPFASNGVSMLVPRCATFTYAVYVLLQISPGFNDKG